MFHAKNIHLGEVSSFDLCRGNEKLCELETTVLGEHNIQNIVGVVAFLITLKLSSIEKIKEAVATFRGVRRRLDRKSEKTIIPIFEGFGSSYEKLESSISAMKAHFPKHKLVVVFEPNTISWRSRNALEQYGNAFVGTSKVLIFKPPHDGKQTELTLDEIVSKIRQGGIDASGVETSEEALDIINQVLGSDACILLSSSGAMGGLADSIPKLAEKGFPNY